MLIDIFVRIESFFRRLESYTEVRPTAAMTDVIVNILIEILSILGIATKQIKQGRSSELTDIHNLYFRFTYFRKISEEAIREERYRGWAEEAGYTYNRRGSDGDC